MTKKFDFSALDDRVLRGIQQAAAAELERRASARWRIAVRVWQLRSTASRAPWFASIQGHDEARGAIRAVGGLLGDVAGRDSEFGALVAGLLQWSDRWESDGRAWSRWWIADDTGVEGAVASRDLIARIQGLRGERK